jgi:signal transduction histidine kinase
MPVENQRARAPAPRILVVDDDTISLELLRRIFEPEYRVTCVDSGGAALEALGREQFDAVLLDVMMPDISGLEVLRRIREHSPLSDLPVILVSVLDAASDIVNGLKLGASDYLPKPFDVNEALARVNTHVKLKRLMDERNRTIAQLEASDKMRDYLFQIASHDLKAPLTNLSMAEFVLRELVGDHPTGKQVLDTMMMTIENMQTVISDFLDMAACQSGQIKFNIECLSVERAIREVVTQYQMAAQKKNIKLETRALDGGVFADKARLAQIIGNLVSNALKYSPPGATVTIWTERLLKVVRVNVADEGPGILPEERDLLFKEFSKLSARPTADESSTGLGLWIAKQLTTLQNGAIGVDSPEESGSVFWIELPDCA